MKRQLSKLITILSVFFALLFGPVTTVQAQVIFSDDFSGDLRNWEIVEGDPNIWHTNLGVLVGDISSQFTQSIIVPKDEVWPENISNYQVAFDMLPVQGIDKNVLFAYETPTDWYEVHFNNNGSVLIKVENGAVVWREESTKTIKQNGIWYHFDLILKEGHIIFKQDSVEIFNHFDPNYEGSYYKPGFRLTTGIEAPTEIYFDNLTVSETADNSISLPVPLFKQTDPLWGETIYDTAQSWSETPTIGAWGCALTSAVMILQYHGFPHLPDGTPLNPESLNTWLINEPDGYVGDGLVNWLAITRLTYILGQANNQYALEYQKHLPSTDSIRAQLKHNQPVILQIPGHFLVGSGLTSNEDITIKDPAYTFSKLSEHQAANRDMLSFRSFTPSFTDLSHILIVHDPEINITITHNEQPAGAITTKEYLSSFASSESTDPILLTELAQPTKDTYTLSVTTAETQPTEITVHTYSEDGNVESKNVALTASNYPTEYTIKFNKETKETPNITRNYSFSNLQQDLENMTINGDLYYWWLYFTLAEIVVYAQEANPTDQLRYLTLIRNTLKTYESLFSPQAQTYLRENLAIMETQLQENTI